MADRGGRGRGFRSRGGYFRGRATRSAGSVRGGPRGGLHGAYSSYPADTGSAGHNSPNKGHHYGKGNERGHGRGRGRGRGGYYHEKEGQIYPFLLLEQMNSSTYDPFKCLVMCSKEGFRLLLESLEADDQKKMNLLLSVIRKSLESNTHQNEYAESLADMLFGQDFIQTSGHYLATSISGLHVQVNIVEPMLIDFLAIVDRLMVIDWQRAQKIRQGNLMVLSKLLNGSDGMIKQEIIDKYASAVESLRQREKDQQELEKRQKQEARLERAGRVVTERKPVRGEFRKMAIYPTKGMVLQTVVEIRKNHPEGAFDDDDDYLDIQFRLLREDLVSSLRESISEMRNSGSVRKSDAQLYTGLNVVTPSFGGDGITFVIQFYQNDPLFKGVKWKVSKRLIYGSLLCLSTDSFRRVIIFATVAERDEISKGYFNVQILPSSEEEMEKHVKPGGTVDILESASYYESYRHVLKAMQSMRSVPFSSYIVQLSKNWRLPLYLEKRPFYEYKLTGQHNTYSILPAGPYPQWPNLDQLDLNPTQFEAYKTGLTQEFSLIQGPPGTGKTYVGLKIAEVLLHNLYGISEVLDSKDEQTDEELRPIHTPLLVICYTNHALDQFLEGIIEFCNRKDVVRVGKRSKSEELEECLLSRKPKPRRSHYTEIGKIRGKIDEIKRFNKMHDYTNWLKKSYMYLVYDSHLRLSEYETAQIDSIAEELGISQENRHIAIYFWLGVEVDILKTTTEADEQPDSAIQNSAVNQDQNLDGDDTDDDDGCVDIEDMNGKEIDDDHYSFSSYQIKHDQEQQEFHDTGNAEDTEGLTRIITKRERYKARQTIKEELRKTSTLSDEEVAYYMGRPDGFRAMNTDDRWKLYRRWLNTYRSDLSKMINIDKKTYNRLISKLNSLRLQEDLMVMKSMKVIGMTTTCAAKYHEILEQIGPEIIIIEEAAEVLEGHVITSLSAKCKHLILIGDHKQLRPSPNVYDLARNYNLELSLFERMINNKLSFVTLDEQHRMRPEIKMFMDHIYPDLKSHPSVEDRPNIEGIGSPVYFLHHTNEEKSDRGNRSKSNEYEAKYIVELCRYLRRRNYEPSDITIITMYVGQLLLIRSMMPKDDFDGVKITAVDNFQGEENRIILLSLVRSNADDKLGFVAIENRICVSLSRAREGMYVVGNMNMLARGSALWEKITTTAKQHKFLGTKLPIDCVNHDKSQFIEKPEDFKTLAPRGGCSQKCAEDLPCGHICPQYCHYYDPHHHKFICQEPCMITLECGHPCEAICGRKPCPPCMVPKDVTMPICGHQQTLKCHQSIYGVDCRYEVQIYCAHCCQTKTVKCYQMDFFKCDTVCAKYLLECGHKCEGTCFSCRMICSRRCKSACGKELECGHKCRRRCCVTSAQLEECDPCLEHCPYKCSSHDATCRLTCGEHTGKSCNYHDNLKTKCKNKCPHTRCRRACDEPCSHIPCMVPCNKQVACPSCKKSLLICMGVCGEKCIYECMSCDSGEVRSLQEEHRDGLFIRLGACQHVFEINQLLQSLRSKAGIKGHFTPKCPRSGCNRVIVESRFRHLAYTSNLTKTRSSEMRRESGISPQDQSRRESRTKPQYQSSRSRYYSGR